MLNRWLLYQTLVCRVWARAGFYQAGGAYGFRDQLQDVMALDRRARTSRAAALPRGGAAVRRGRRAALVASALGPGVRTRISDDLVWLPYAAAHYMAVTGDARSSTRDPVPRGRLAGRRQLEAYFEPRSRRSAPRSSSTAPGARPEPRVGSTGCR
jgi:cyclic beta-1,2-glucan synthetase